MILGLGSDLVDINRIEKMLTRFGDRFTTRIFTPLERQKCETTPRPAAAYAKRFAAKEAFVKALGTGITQQVVWQDIGVVNAESGQPMLQISNGALQQLLAKLPQGHKYRLHLTMTDEAPYAQATVIIEACL